MTRIISENIYNKIFNYAVEHWGELSKKAECWRNEDSPIPVSVQLVRKFGINEHDAAEIARSVAILKSL